MVEQSELYLYLPSSVTSTVIENKISHFTTTFHSPINLQTQYEYEAALLKIIYPATATNVYDGRITYYNYTLKKLEHTRIKKGQYMLPDQFIDAFNKVLLNDSSKNYKLMVDQISKRFYLHCTSGDGGKTQPFISFSGNLQTLTGLPEEVSRTGYTYGVNSWNVSGGLQNLYVYTDLVQQSNIGNTLAPILAVINYSGIPGDNRQQIQYEPQTPIYIPVVQNILDTITVELRTKTGQYFPFMSGESFLLIHIKPKLPPFL